MTYRKDLLYHTSDIILTTTCLFIYWGCFSHWTSV